VLTAVGSKTQETKQRRAGSVAATHQQTGNDATKKYRFQNVRRPRCNEGTTGDAFIRLLENMLKFIHNQMQTYI